VQSRISTVATPAVPSSAQPKALAEEKSVAAKNEAAPITSEEETSSDSSSGNASE